jgi:hypothetical protein
LKPGIHLLTIACLSGVRSLTIVNCVATLKAYAKRVGGGSKQAADFRFQFDGDDVSRTATPEDADMEQEDANLIDVYPK